MNDNFDRSYWGDRIDISRWDKPGGYCAMGINYAETGAPVPDGQAGTVRKISTGRKSRGSSSKDYAKRDKLRL